MRKHIFTLLFLSLSLTSFSQQCSWLDLSVSTADSSFVQLYHPGPYLITPKDNNVITYEITDFQGNIVHQDTTIGGSGLMLFNHTVPVTDSMKVTALLTNDVAGIACFIEDTLFWKETVVGSTSIFNWDILSGNLGFSVLDVNESHIDGSDFRVFPSPAFNELYIDSPEDSYSFTISNIRGQLIFENKSSSDREKVDVSNFPSGLYFLTISSNRGLETIRFAKK